jgi:hypothetical protein
VQSVRTQQLGVKLRRRRDKLKDSKGTKMF